jgi:hypothetical protein
MPQPHGGLTAFEILARFDESRFASAAAARASRLVGDLEWRPAQVASIAVDDQRATWHTGHIHAVVSDGNSVVAGSDAGGAWLINPIVSPTYRDGYRAIPLSDRWETPGILSLAFGPDGREHVYAGCRDADNLFLIELQAVVGAMIVKQSDLRIPLPSRASVNAIVAIDQPRRLVIGTDDGLFWSDVPARPTDVNGYSWSQAVGLPLGTCVSIARGPGTAVACAWGAPVSIKAGTPKSPAEPDRLFAGDWIDGVLTLTPANVPDIAKTNADGFVLASCASARDRMYMTAMDNQSTILCVLRSDNGGRDWYAAAMPADVGEQGYHNRAIGVSAYRPDVVALGWVKGPFLSSDGGARWSRLTGSSGVGVDGLPCHGKARGLHDDIHAVCFPFNSLQADYLIVASDGGVVMTRDLGQCFDSDYNRSLAVLEFYGTRPAIPGGTLAVSSRFPGLLASGTQDNGNITLHPDHDAGAVWHWLAGGDGGVTRFVDPLGALLHRYDGAPAIRLTTWDDATHAFRGEGNPVPVDGNPAGLAPNAIETVAAPAWRRSGQLVYACAGSANGDVHGFFADADGGRAAFLRIGNVGGSITAVASLTGAQILTARSDGLMIALDTMTGLWHEQPRDDTVPTSGTVTRIEVVSTQAAYALKGSQLLSFDGQTWTAVSGPQPWTVFTVEGSTGRLFAASDADVFSSVDGGRTWKDASVGLPGMPRISDMRVGADDAGGNTLYLTTYGRSAWRATITLPPESSDPFKLPSQARVILLRLIQEGTGIVRIGDDFTAIGASESARDVLAALAIDQIAQTMSPDARREMRRTALRQIQRAIAREMESLR